MPYKQSSNPLSRKTSPLRRSPFKKLKADPASQHENSVSDDEHFRLSSNNDEHSVMVLAPGEENKSTTFDRDFDAATNTKEDAEEVMRQEGDPNDIVKNVTSTILETAPKIEPVGTEAGGLDQLQVPVRTEDLIDLDSKLNKKALASIDAANNENLSADDRNIAERRARRQLARQQRKEIRKNQPKGKERREAIKKTRENQGRKEENMVSE